MSEKRNSKWGIGIAALYGGFVLFILACVGYASLQHFDLVEPHYYEKTLAYQGQIDKLNRTAALAERPVISFSPMTQAVTIEFPAYQRTVDGNLLFYRPSVAAMDFSVPLALDTLRTQTIMDRRLSSGYWRAKLTWTMNGDEYFVEQDLLVP